MTTPAETLRAAAAKLRETAKPLLESDDNDWTWRDFFTLHGADLGLLREDEEWIALASPEIAEPLATAMVAVADAVELDADFVHRVGYGEVLATARAITGGAS